MKTGQVNEVVNTIYNVLEPHATYISKGADDTDHYFVPAEILEALSWIISNVMVPIITGVTSGVTVSVLVERIKKRREEQQIQALVLEREEIESLKLSVQTALNHLEEKTSPCQNDFSLVEADLVEILMINGWPTDLAKRDAEEILLRVEKCFDKSVNK
ncbi:MAG: hypothetical protein L3J98_11235 [Gammaproteobacteria bacterium]|nr:hypothetical protein [Gammaproteobacteria bacterium]